MLRDLGLYIQVSIASLSLLCSLLTIFLIYVMKKWNGYSIMIVNLSLAQSIYDVSIIMSCGSGDDFFTAERFLRYFSGSAASLWTNVILLVVAYVVYKLQIFDVKKNFLQILIVIVISPALTVSVLQLKFPQIMLYFWFRIASIALNIFVYLAVQRKLRLMSTLRPDWSINGWKDWWRGKSRYRTESSNELKRDPIRLLAHRLKYYPMVQILSRVGVAWFEFITHTDGFTYAYSIHAPVKDQVAFFLYSFTQPSAGIGFFIVFLWVSPGASAKIQSTILKLCPWLSCCLLSSNNASLNISQNISIDYGISGNPMIKENAATGSLGSLSSNTQVDSGHSLEISSARRDDFTDFTSFDEEQLASAITARYRSVQSVKSFMRSSTKISGLNVSDLRE